MIPINRVDLFKANRYYNLNDWKEFDSSTGIKSLLVSKTLFIPVKAYTYLGITIFN
jgi:hypothetical protein